MDELKKSGYSPDKQLLRFPTRTGLKKRNGWDSREVGFYRESAAWTNKSPRGVFSRLNKMVHKKFNLCFPPPGAEEFKIGYKRYPTSYTTDEIRPTTISALKYFGFNAEQIASVSGMPLFNKNCFKMFLRSFGSW